MSVVRRVLVIEDDAALREVVTFNLEDLGWRVDTAATGEAGVLAYNAARHDVVLSDLRLGAGISGMDVLEQLIARDADAVVVMMTAYGSADRAVEAMQRGAFHYVEKPVNRRALEAILTRALEHRVLRRGARVGHPALISASPAMNEVMRVVDRIATSDATVLIRGESGTGKELVARALHERSERAQAPFVAINCAAIPDDLLESVLFGHARGAFTGAVRESRGKFLQADGGTLFLDEIAEMSVRLQSKFLRVLQDGEVDVLGAAQPVRVNVRVVAATHQALEARIKEGSFRQDLYYRLAVIPLTVPPLRERREDIPVLARHLLRRHGHGELRIEAAVDEGLLSHDWPGNVRELENMLTRMALLSDGVALRAADLPEELRVETTRTRRESGLATQQLPFALPEDELDLAALEVQIIRAALHKHDGNQSATARYLRMPRHALLYRLEKHAITHEP